MLNNIDYKNIIDFSCDLGQFSHNFYENCLNLMLKHFRYKHLSFVPEILNTKSSAEINKVYYKNFYSINIQDEFIRDFKQFYYKDSIFQPLNLQEELLTRNVITIEDIMPYEEFIHTKNAEFLNKYNYRYRLNINLFRDNIRIGVLCIFKTEIEGNFTKREIEITNILSNVISTHYNNYLELSNSIFKKNIFKTFYNIYDTGFVIWDNNQEIIELNSLAEEYSLSISEKLNSSNNFLYSNLIQIEEPITPINKLINYLTLNYTENVAKQSIDIEVNNYIYNIKIATTPLPELNNKIKNYNFAIITRTINKNKFSKNKLKDLYNLTDRELEIIELIKQGYSNNEISKLLYLSLNTVKTHITNIYKKLNVNNRTSLVSKL